MLLAALTATSFETELSDTPVCPPIDTEPVDDDTAAFRPAVRLMSLFEDPEDIATPVSPESETACCAARSTLEFADTATLPALETRLTPVLPCSSAAEA